MTKISIVTPSYNQAPYIGEALESVRLQKHNDVEHLILDGGSDDGTVGLLRSLDGKAEWAHLRWRSEPDSGQSEALNSGFRIASGEIVGWLNSDDRYRPGCFDHVLKAFADHPDVDIFYGDYALIDRHGEFLKVRREISFNHFILLYHRVLYIATTATFFRRRVFQEENWLRPDLHYAMDYEFFLRLAAAGYRIEHISTVLADFRLHAESKSCRMERTQLLEKKHIMHILSPVSQWIPSRIARRTVFAVLQAVAGLMRWSLKFVRGFYFADAQVNKS